jgi:hypothetical protein
MKREAKKGNAFDLKSEKKYVARFMMGYGCYTTP